MRFADKFLRHDALEQPAAAANLLPASSAVAADTKKTLGIGLLCVMALWNNPDDAGEIKFALVSIAPADWPPSVTFAGSPPNAAMFRCTHRNAACESRMP